jgi:hypothetical protein
MFIGLKSWKLQLALNRRCLQNGTKPSFALAEGFAHVEVEGRRQGSSRVGLRSAEQTARAGAGNQGIHPMPATCATACSTTLQNTRTLSPKPPRPLSSNIVALCRRFHRIQPARRKPILFASRIDSTVSAVAPPALRVSESLRPRVPSGSSEPTPNTRQLEARRRTLFGWPGRRNPGNTRVPLLLGHGARRHGTWPHVQPPTRLVAAVGILVARARWMTARHLHLRLARCLLRYGHWRI